MRPRIPSTQPARKPLELTRFGGHNALAESLFATIECELFDQQPRGRFETRREAKLAVFDYFETFYNPGRRHSSLGQISPARFELEHTARNAAA